MDFTTIPLNLLTPGVDIEFDNSRMVSGLVAQPKRALIIGQRLSSGTVAAAIPIRIPNKGVAQSAFGRSSMLAAMCEAWLRQNEYAELWAVALNDNGAGVAAVGSITFTGPATAAGTLQLYVAGTRLSVGVTSGMTAAQLATATAAAINADASLPITAAVSGGTPTVVDTTARHKGEVGNSIDCRVNYNQGDMLPAGIGVSIVCPEDGTTNPTISTALAAIGAVQYTTIVHPYTDATNLTALEAELSSRWGGMNTNDGHAFSAVAGTHADGSTLGDSRNSPHSTILPTQKSPTWVPIVAALVGALDAGESHPARPRQTLVLKGMLPPSVADRYTRSERNLHLLDGMASYVVDDGGLCRVERLVTTYKTNAQSVTDPSYRDVETMRTLSFMRFSARARISQVYPRHMLADDGNEYDSEIAIVTPREIKAEMVALAGDWYKAAILENLEQFKRDVRARRADDDRNTVELLLPPDIVNQFRNLRGAIQPRL